MMRIISATSAVTAHPAGDAPPIPKPLQFIVTNSDAAFKGSQVSEDVRREHKRQVRSHVSRGRPRRAKGGRHLSSWVSKDAPRDNSDVHTFREGTFDSLARLRRGWDLVNWTQLPEGVDLSVLYAGMEYLRQAMDSMYPQSLCENISDAAASAWTGYMLSDAVYLQSIKFAAAAQADAAAGRKASLSTLHYAATAIHSLQQRLSDSSAPEAISDPTIMSVVLLARAADQMDHRGNMENHVGGLKTMIALRGGFAALPSTTDELWTKVCRTDLSAALRRGAQPVFFRENISWDVYLTTDFAKKTALSSGPPEVSAVMDAVDVRLRNVWLDLRTFSSMANLAHQTGRKVPTDYFAEIVTSIMYRLFHQSYQEGSLEETMRVGMLVYAAGVMFKWDRPCNVEQKQHMMPLFTDSLLSMIDDSSSPDPLVLWLLVVWLTLAASMAEKQSLMERIEGSLHATLTSMGISKWKDVKQSLKSVLWIDVLHDRLGKVVVEQTLSQQRNREG